jgi:3-hydroxyacyl-CoA dehydrogenase / 3-hydroxy-2-methylbutyryl-CoA dehydrogenase
MATSKIVALITGGSSGLGAATAKALLQHGAKVCVADLSSQHEIFDAWASTIMDYKQQQQQQQCGVLQITKSITYAATDVTNTDQIINALDHIEETFGEPVNAVINCAGIAIAKRTFSKTGSHPVEDFTKTVMINLVGTFNVNRLAAERMINVQTSASSGASRKQESRGCIINTASIAAFEGQVGQVAYAASKGGIVGMTLPMARDLAPYGIRVMTIVRETDLGVTYTILIAV